MNKHAIPSVTTPSLILQPRKNSLIGSLDSVKRFSRIDAIVSQPDVQAMLDRAELCRRFAKGEKFEYLFFWGHQPDKDGKITASCLSQWYVAPLVAPLGDI